jgi:6,7-dimethyl-8-ribityllumazine synthase
MATTNLSDYDPAEIPDAVNMRFGIVVADWNSEITFALLDGAVNTLVKHGADNNNIIIRHVPGSFELTLGAQLIAENEDVDAILCLGCVIQGETPHFTYICQSVTMGITQLNMDYNIPVIFGVLTTDNIQQAKERSGGIHGNKGDEAAITAIKMITFQKDMEQ